MRDALFNFEAKRPAHKVPNVPWLPQLGDAEKIDQIIAHLQAEEGSALKVHEDLVSLNAGAQMRVEINAFCLATENVAVLDGAYNILVAEAAQVDG